MWNYCFLVNTCTFDIPKMFTFFAHFEEKCAFSGFLSVCNAKLLIQQTFKILGIACFRILLEKIINLSFRCTPSIKSERNQNRYK